MFTKQVTSPRKNGPDVKYVQIVGLDKFPRRELKRRKIAFPVERALLAMVMHRAQGPSSKLQDFYWLRNEAFAPWGAKVELHHLYRSLDFLQENRDALESGLYADRRDLLNRSVQLIYFDTTTVHFEIDDDPEEPPLEGLPLLSETFAGNTVDSKTIAPVLRRLKGMGVQDVVFVADRGAVSQTNLKAIRKAELHYIVGLRLRNAERDSAS